MMNSETSDPGEEEEVNEYEQQRLVCIADNKAKLKSLGLHEAVQSLRKPRKARRCRSVESPKGIIKATRTRRGSLPRRSTRIRHEEAPTQHLRHGNLDRYFGGSPKIRSPPKGTPSYKDADSFAGLNQHRISTMSETALRNRIGKIRNVPKMRSFIEELREGDLPHLAADAEAALEHLTGVTIGG